MFSTDYPLYEQVSQDLLTLFTQFHELYKSFSLIIHYVSKMRKFPDELVVLPRVVKIFLLFLYSGEYLTEFPQIFSYFLSFNYLKLCFSSVIVINAFSFPIFLSFKNKSYFSASSRLRYSFLHCGHLSFIK